jgi:hypothetical protein
MHGRALSLLAGVRAAVLSVSRFHNNKSGDNMRYRLVGTALALILVLSGCQPEYTKLERSTETSGAPDFYCLLETSRDLADGRALTYSVQDLPGGTAHGLTYIHAKSYYSWWVVVTPRGAVKITHSSGVENSRPDDLPKVRSRLLEVEGILRNRCGMGTSMDSAREVCHGKACSSLQAG